MENRKKTIALKQRPPRTGYLKRYAAQVSSADKGAVLDL
jgi:dihydroxyacid dehydratase/phosphogluconate dehydratase